MSEHVCDLPESIPEGEVWECRDPEHDEVKATRYWKMVDGVIEPFRVAEWKTEM